MISHQVADGRLQQASRSPLVAGGLWDSWRDIEGAREKLRGANCEGRLAREKLRGANCEGDRRGYGIPGGTLRGEEETARGELRGATSEGKTARGKLRGATCEGDKRTARATSEQRGREARSVQACSEVYPCCH